MKPKQLTTRQGNRNMFFYFAIFIGISLLSLVSLTGTVRKITFSVFIALILILTAGLRQPGIDNDSKNYVVFYNEVSKPSEYFTDYANHYYTEPGFYLVPSVLKNVFHAGAVWFFIVMAILGVSIKISAIWKLTEFQILSILVYFCHFFILHDMTQVREGVASGILLLSLLYIENRKLFKFLLVLSVGIFFHYSAFVFLPFYFLNPKKLKKAVFYLILLVPVALYFAHINIINLMLFFKLGVLTEKLTLYNDLAQVGMFADINVFNSVVIVQLLFCIWLIWKSEFLFSKNKYAILLIKVYTIGLASWIIFYPVPVISFRISGFLEIVEIILVPFILYYIEETYIAAAFVILYGFGLLYVNVVHSELLLPYATVKLLS